MLPPGATAPPPRRVLAAAIVKECAKSLPAGLNPMVSRAVSTCGLSRVRRPRQNSTKVTSNRKSPRSQTSPPMRAEIARALRPRIRSPATRASSRLRKQVTRDRTRRQVEGISSTNRGLQSRPTSSPTPTERVEFDDAYSLSARRSSPLNELLPRCWKPWCDRKPLVIGREDVEARPGHAGRSNRLARLPQGCRRQGSVFRDRRGRCGRTSPC